MAIFSTLPFEHPTTMILVDDDSIFLKSLALALHRQGMIKTYVSPKNALADIKAQGEMLHDLIPAGKLPRVDDPKRFGLYSLLITDYEMGSINGIELCEKIGDNPIGRILLTGKADESYAVRAFNEEVIDRYVRKGDSDMIELIIKFSQELKHEFFRRTASLLSGALSHEQARFLGDPVFCDYFSRSLHENDIVEYYLSASFPGYLMLDADGDVLVFAVLTERQMAEHVEVAENENAPKELLDLLRAGLAIPFFPTRGGFYSADFLETWKNWTFTAKLIEGRKRYYHSVISGPAAHTVFSDRPVFSYNNYLSTASNIKE